MFKKITFKDNLAADKKIIDSLGTKYGKVICAANYGSQVINRDTKKSDYDFLVITKSGKIKKVDFELSAKKATLNIISIQDLMDDANGKFKYYYVGKLVNPCNFYFFDDFEGRLKTVISQFIISFCSKIIKSGTYNRRTLVNRFLSAYVKVHPFYHNYAHNWGATISKIQKRFFESCFLSDNISINGTDDIWLSKYNAQQILMEWTIFGYDLRHHQKYFPTKYIEKNLKKLNSNSKYGK